MPAEPCEDEPPRLRGPTIPRTVLAGAQREAVGFQREAASRSRIWGTWRYTPGAEPGKPVPLRGHHVHPPLSLGHCEASSSPLGTSFLTWEIGTTGRAGKREGVGGHGKLEPKRRQAQRAPRAAPGGKPKAPTPHSPANPRQAPRRATHLLSGGRRPAPVVTNTLKGENTQPGRDSDPPAPPPTS